MRIKNIELGHAEAFGQLQMEIFQENNFMLVEPDEHKTKLHELAISCYKTNGFVIEGVRSQSLKINDEWVDEFYMAKILE